MGQSAQEILVQNMMVNAMRQGIQTSFAATAAPAAMLNYSETSALQKQLLAENVVARTATYLLPLMQTVLFLICIGLFPLIMLFALQPWIFVSMLKNYLSALIYLGIWPSLFVIINFLMTTALSHSMNGIAIDQGGITLSNQNALLYATEQFAGYAGYLIGLVPVMAGFLFFGLHKTFMNAAQTMVGSMQSRVSSSAEALAEGNVNVGNVSVGNHSWNNWSANKHDLNATNFQGMSSTQQPNGAVISQTQDGKTVLNTTGAISQLPTHINWSSSVSQNASKQAALHRSEAASMASDFQSSVAETSQNLASLSHSQSQNEGSGKSWNLTDNTHVNEALHHAATATHQYAQKHDITDQQANQVLLGAAFSVNGGVSNGNGAGVKLGASGDLSARVEKTSLSQESSNFSDAKEFAKTSGFSKDISFVQEASRTQSYHANTEEGKNLLSSFSTHLDKAQQASQQWSTQLSEAENYDKLSSIAQSQGAAFNQNLDQQYVEWMAKQPRQGESSPMGFKGANEVLTNPTHTNLSREYANQFVQQQTENLARNFQTNYGSTASKAEGISVPTNTLTKHEASKVEDKVLTTPTHTDLSRDDVNPFTKQENKKLEKNFQTSLESTAVKAEDNSAPVNKLTNAENNSAPINKLTNAENVSAPVNKLANAENVSAPVNKLKNHEESKLENEFRLDKMRLFQRATMNNLSFEKEIDKSAQVEAEQQLIQEKNNLQSSEAQIRQTEKSIVKGTENRLHDGMKGNLKVLKERVIGRSNDTSKSVSDGD